jgi:indolepyruvate ferredoxin oxidoreductase
VAEGFTDVRSIRFHMAPPILGRKGPDGHPRKSEFGPWMMSALKILAKMKGLRGGVFDLFGYTAERKFERGLIAQYEADMDDAQARFSPETRDAAIALALLPLQIRGFGHVKYKNAEAAAARREELLDRMKSGGDGISHAAE